MHIAQSKMILAVEDEMKIADVLQSYLQNEGYAVACAYCGCEALELFDKHSPDLVLLDLMLPDMAGEDVCRAIRRKSGVPVIMITAKIDDENILKGLAIGADDYVTKPFSPREVVARVNAVLRRIPAETIPVEDELSFNNGDLVIDNLRHEVRKNGELVQLTPNEYKNLFTLAKYRIKAFTREETITLALGSDFEGFDRVVDTHVKNIRQKIEEDLKSPRYILTVHGVGYKFGGGEIENKP